MSKFARKVNRNKTKALQPSAIIPPNRDSALAILHQVTKEQREQIDAILPVSFEAFMGAQGFEVGYQQGRHDERKSEYNTKNYSDARIVHLMKHVEVWRLHCHTVDVVVKGKLPPNQIKNMIDLSLGDAIQTSYDDVKKAWQDESDFMEQLAGVGFADLDTIRPDIKAATDARTEAINALYSEPMNAEPIKALEPVNISIVDFINQVKIGRDSVNSDLLTVDAAAMRDTKPQPSYAKIAITLTSRYKEELKNATDPTRRKVLTDALSDLGSKNPGEMIRLRLMRKVA